MMDYRSIFQTLNKAKKKKIISFTIIIFSAKTLKVNTLQHSNTTVYLKHIKINNFHTFVFAVYYQVIF